MKSICRLIYEANDKKLLLKKNTVKCINHSSLLITNNEGKFLLTDPWFISPVFSTWHQYPYPNSDSVFYLIKKSMNSINNFSIFISNGHNNHCDDFIIKHHFKNNKLDLMISKNRSKSKKFELWKWVLLCKPE